MQNVDGVSILVFAVVVVVVSGVSQATTRDKWARKYRFLIIAMAHTLTHSLTHMSSTHDEWVLSNYLQTKMYTLISGNSFPPRLTFFFF